MKKSIVRSVAVVSSLIMLAGNVFAVSPKDDNKKTKKENVKTNASVEPNGNYKHIMPSSPGNKLKYSFTKPEKDKINGNYKQQNREKGNVKFKDHFINIEKTNHSSYKHQQGL